jgi:5-methyltetrahydropteroyltriglutamate--homocysteine methyltransferase
MASHVVGYPHMDPKREIEFSLESFWNGKSSVTDLEAVAKGLRVSIWKQMVAVGVKLVPSNTFSYYDQVLDIIAMIGVVPPRYGFAGGEGEIPSLKLVGV